VGHIRDLTGFSGSLGAFSFQFELLLKLLYGLAGSALDPDQMAEKFHDLMPAGSDGPRDDAMGQGINGGGHGAIPSAAAAIAIGEIRQRGSRHLRQLLPIRRTTALVHRSSLLMGREDTTAGTTKSSASYRRRMVF